MFANKYNYILLNYTYIGITTSISLGSSICVIFILLMQLVNGSQLFLNISFLLELFGATVVSVFGIVIVHYNHINLTSSLKF